MFLSFFLFFFLSKDNAIEDLFIISQRIPNTKRYNCLTKVGSIKAIFKMKKESSFHDKESPSPSDCFAGSMILCPRA